ncbi:MAG: ABC transporter ATP-binding protein [Alphaproteobacteria bacterium]|nr:ABC transporter ATP-binding protein [Alphaproteobacteria bacterium]MBM3952811.1 ABC transporter ATP-binding protein [Rhodospirillales bacterium]
MTSPDSSAALSAPLARLDGVRRAFGATVAVDDVTLDVAEGEFLTLLGASGCGKTTLLRMLAGFERPDRGRVYIGGADATDTPPYRRPVNMMFQSYALFPHMTVADNVAFGLRQEGMAKPMRDARVAEMLDLVHLTGLAARKPHQLSGGQAQRVALARSLAKHPRLLLLDEPLAALDRVLREKTQFELMDLQKRVGITFVMVTHDQEEAMTMSSRIAVMNAGRIVQIGAPADIYENPASRFVASFVGAANILEGRIARASATETDIEIAGLGPVRVRATDGSAAGAACAVALRPEKIAVGPAPAGQCAARGVVAEVGYMGGLSVYHVRIGETLMLRVQTANRERGGRALAPGSAVELHWPAEACVPLKE